MKRGLALLRLGNFVVVGIILIAVLPFAIDTLQVVNTLQRQLAPAETQARRLLSAATDQETGVRGYVLTARADFLSPFHSGTVEAAAAIGRLEQLGLGTAGKEALHTAIAALDQWRSTSALHTIRLVDSGNLTAARSIRETTNAKQLFDDFRVKITTFVTQVEQRVTTERAALHRNSILAIVALLVAGVVAGVTGAFLQRWIRSSIRRDERRLREQLALAEVHHLSSTLSSSRSPEEIGTLAVHEAARALGASAVHLWAADERDRLLLVGSTDSLAQSGSAPSVLSTSDTNAPADAIRQGRALYFETPEQYAQRYPGWTPVLDVQGATSVAVVPTAAQQDPIGALEVFYDTQQSFAEMQQTVLALVATQIGSALGRARTRTREHEAAARLQDSLLGPRTLVDGVGHSTRYLPAEATLHVGGDWHNAQHLPDGRTFIAVGDVVGRGLDAATVMGQLRSAASACALRSASPADLLLSLDDFAATLPGASSTTIVIGFVDTRRATLDYVCAGHPPPLLVSPTGEVRILDGGVTWPLAIGYRRQGPLGASEPFPPGSLVLMYSDGLVERRSESLDDGIARLSNAVAANWNLPIDMMCDRVLATALRGQRRDDDVALLALRSPALTRDLFLMKTPATTASVGRVREQLRSWLDDDGIPTDDQLAILVAVGEACTNAVEHAYPADASNLFRVEACRRDGEVLCCITDAGAWKDNAVRTARGNGLAIMNELMDSVVIERRTSGTSVVLTYRLGSHDAAAVRH